MSHSQNRLPIEDQTPAAAVPAPALVDSPAPITPHLNMAAVMKARGGKSCRPAPKFSTPKHIF